jgi:uncharacterized protein (DUF736 family)
VVKQYDNNMRGVLFKNEKRGNEKAPDYRGSAVIDNIDLNISAWIKRSSKTGDAFISLKFEPKQAARPKTMAEQNPEKFNDDEDLPF